MLPTKEEVVEARSIINDAINVIHSQELALNTTLTELDSEDNVACLVRVLKARGIPKIVEKAITTLGTAYGLLLAANEDLAEIEETADDGLFPPGDSPPEPPPEE